MRRREGEGGGGGSGSLDRRRLKLLQIFALFNLLHNLADFAFLSSNRLRDLASGTLLPSGHGGLPNGVSCHQGATTFHNAFFRPSPRSIRELVPGSVW